MYVTEDQVPVLGALGAVQSGMIPSGALVLVPAGTVVSTYDPLAAQPLAVTHTLTKPLSLVLAGDAEASADVGDGPLIADGISVALSKVAAANPPLSIEGSPVTSGWLASIPAGTVVTIQTLPGDVTVTPVTDGGTPPAAPKPWYKSTGFFVALGTVAVLGAVAAGLAIHRRHEVQR